MKTTMRPEQRTPAERARMKESYRVLITTAGRAAVVKKYLEGYTQKEIAASYGYTTPYPIQSIIACFVMDYLTYDEWDGSYSGDKGYGAQYSPEHLRLCLKRCQAKWVKPKRKPGN